MAKMVTRTILSTEVKAVTANLSENKLEEVTYNIPGKITNKDKALNILKKAYTTTDRIPTTVNELTLCEKLYSMPEETFIEYAVELPPRASKKEVAE
jgi:hypothetical protein